MNPKENDIYRWSWKDDIASKDYHCYSTIAVFVDGGFRDTFWYDWKERSWLNPDKIDLVLLGNIDECDKISRWQISYYDPSDVIDMAHANDSNAPVFLKRTAVKSQARMLEYAQWKEQQAFSDKCRAENELLSWGDKIRRIKAGDLEVYL